MHRLLSTSVLAAALAAGVALAPARAAPVSGLSAVPADAARSASIVDQARCCWRYVGWHRYWWRRWRRY